MVVALREKTGKERAGSFFKVFFFKYFFLSIFFYYFLSCELSSVQAIEIVSIARVVGDCSFHFFSFHLFILLL